MDVDKRTRPVMPQDADAEARLEAQAIRWCESLGSKLSAKRSDY